MNVKLIETAIKTALGRYGYKEFNIIRSIVSQENTDVLGITFEFGMKPEKLYYKLDLTFERYTLIWVETGTMGVPMHYLKAIEKAIKEARKELRK